MPCFISRLLHVGIKTLFFLLLTASAQQFDTAPTLDIQDTAIQLSTKPLNPDPDVLPDAQATIQPQIPDLLTQFQYPDDEAFTPPIISLSAPDTQTAKPNSQLSSGFCPISANLKPGASRLLRRGYGEFKPCCDPVNLGLEGPFGWIFGRTTVEDRFPYCCEGGGIEYAATRMCVPCMYSSSFPNQCNPHTHAI